MEKRPGTKKKMEVQKTIVRNPVGGRRILICQNAYLGQDFRGRGRPPDWPIGGPGFTEVSPHEAVSPYGLERCEILSWEVGIFVG